MSEKIPIPSAIKLHQKSKMLEIAFGEGSSFNLPCEYLRVHSPSAEVRGHGPGQGTLQVGKEEVNISKIEQVGSYAVRLYFDDEHNTGIYSWETLYDLAVNYKEYWAEYLESLRKAGHSHKELS